MRLSLYIPSMHGDIALKASNPTTTLVTFESLSPSEVTALEALKSHSLSNGWAKKSDFEKLPEGTYPFRANAKGSHEVSLDAPIGEVKKILTAQLKPTREVLTAVRIADGKIEEITSQDLTEIAADKSDKLAKATAVAQPTRGCPLPAFERAEIRANRVLEAFLSYEQLFDFGLHNRFVAIGADTGHAYQIRSRHAYDAMETSQSFRSLRDLTEGRDLCVHDWDVPSGEEMLALKLFVELPEREQYLRELPEH